MSAKHDPEKEEPKVDVPEPEKQRGRLSRLRFSKKKDMPGGLWLKCENCGSMVYRKELEERDRVCPSCRFHFTLPARARVAAVLDPETFDVVSQASAAWEAAVCWDDDYSRRRLSEVRALDDGT